MSQPLPPPDSEGDFLPLTHAEQQRVASTLDDVATLTLLNALAGVERDSEDAQLIIATLLGRIHPGDAT